MKLSDIGDGALTAGVFAGIGLVVFAAAFWIMTKVAPFSVRKEIEDLIGLDEHYRVEAETVER